MAFVLLLVAAVVIVPGTSHAADGQVNPTSPTSLTSPRQEAVGVELAPVALSLGKGVTGAHLGVGGLLRLAKHRWLSWYWAPIQTGIYLAGADFSGVILLTAQTEVGAIFPTRSGTWEIGWAAGLGVLAVANGSNDCDGTCNVGGIGMFVSPVVRYLFRDRARVPIGLVLRAQIPAADSSNRRAFGYLVDWGTIVLAGLDVAYGW